MKIKRSPIVDIHRSPLGATANFNTCNLCYGKKSCCKDFGVKHDVLYVNSNFDDWSNLEIKIWACRSKGHYVRLVVDKNIPSSILWASAYDQNNILQINIDLFSNLEPWIPNLAYAADRCGLYFVLMVYPIIPGITKISSIIQRIDPIRAIPHCLIMLKFAEFLSKDSPSTALIKSKINHMLDNGNCTPEYKLHVHDTIQRYAVPQNLIVEVCGGVSHESS